MHGDLCGPMDYLDCRVVHAKTRFAVYRWKPGLCIAAASYSGPGRRKMSGVTPAPVSACRTRSDYVCCSGWVSLPRSVCVIQIRLLHNHLDSYPYDLMIEFVGDWCLTLTFYAGGQNYGSGSSYSHSSASVIGLVLSSK